MSRRSGSRGGRRYGEDASRKVEKAMHELKAGTLRSGRSGRRVRSREQAIAIGLNEARREGVRVPGGGGRRRSRSRRRSSGGRRSSRSRRSGGRGGSR